MQIRLKNIGIIKDSTIALNGLTVITGKNNSGKTTVGKTLYSLFDAVANIQRKAENDKCVYVMRHLNNLDDTLEFLRYSRSAISAEDSDILTDYPTLKAVVSEEYHQEISPETMVELVYKLIDELKAMDTSSFVDQFELRRSSKIFRIKAPDIQKDTLKSSFDKQKAEAIAGLENLISDINKDPELIDYARESINQTLQIEFLNQIQPVKGQDGASQVELWDGDKVYFHFLIEDNHIVDDGEPVFTISPCKKVYLVDDPFILDDKVLPKYLRGRIIADRESFFNPGRIVSHKDKLKFVLRSDKTLTIFEQTVLSDALKKAKSKIDSILPGTFEFSSEGEYYIQDGLKLRISNLATGSKMFSIIKMLLNKGEIDNTTMLILDEPEAHLHPKWQNAFAEIIVLLVKELNVNILLTTHSPNFMLALDAYMRKYEIAEQTNFYQTDVLEDGFVQYHCVNDDIGIIYQDFLQYLSEVKMLRNKYLTDIEE